jgi:hypothetical protein
MAQVVVHLSTKYKVLSSNSILTKNEKESKAYKPRIYFNKLEKIAK